MRERFQRKARSFDRVYDKDGRLQHLLRPAVQRRAQFAASVVASHPSPRVLDVGCGPGRVGELVFAAGAAEYVGVDVSEAMLALARARLARFGERVQLVHGDFIEAPLEGRFEVVIALGLFDYVADPVPFVRRMRSLCSGTTVASFPRWTWTRGPLRKLRYEMLDNCPIFNYAKREVAFLFGAAGFADVEVLRLARTGYVIHARS